jgi:uridine kinase
MITLAAILSRLLNGAERPIVVALDGRSGAGKSTIAAGLAAALPATVVRTDDFFAAEVSSAGWDARRAAERARDALDWRRLRELALEPLRRQLPGSA